MAKRNTVIVLLIFFSFAASCLLIGMMPARVPMHYNAEGEADRLGSRYENLLFPVVTAGMGAFFLVLSGRAAKKGELQNGRLIASVGIAVTGLFFCMELFFLLRAVSYDGAETFWERTDPARISLVGLGAVLFVLCNFMPKATRNALFGLRTPWSMKNDRVWQRCQRFGGYSGMLLGVAAVLCALLLDGAMGMAVFLVLLAVWTGLSVYMSYRFAREDDGEAS